MITRAVTIALAVCLLAGPGSSAFATGGDGSQDGGRQTLRHDGIERGYVVRLPPGWAPDGGLLPLVLVLHGGGGNAANAERMTQFTAKSEQEGFIVVYPEGTGRFKRGLLTWNAGHCCGRAMRNRIDDVGFVDALIDRLLVDYRADPARIYVTGMSNGGMMAHRLGIELADRIAAVAPVVATLFGDEKRPAQPVSAIMLNGMLDKSVPYEGGPPGGRFADAWDGTPARPAMEQAEFWADANGCAGEPERIDRSRYILSRYSCAAGLSVEIYLVKDNGHAWPGGDKGSRRGDEPSTAVHATDVIWAFFRAHSKSVY